MAEKRLEAITKAKKGLEERARQKAEDKDEARTDDARKPPVALVCVLLGRRNSLFTLSVGKY